ncbi:MFS transporter, FHS family, Na+ dependent glucose transporter 1 [Paragonimus westermani]|uniref:MFS transporter, FHS family, Na+ dependent glucose transporter 1 n=1 Tax=Paragonimus westermani TaxID=34504 RepID=A0A5J4NI62_9TREM|nr:MFS transporter, FHS family, Na+ dependent glucose transporter 1 [Paragonimus westermani]
MVMHPEMSPYEPQQPASPKVLMLPKYAKTAALIYSWFCLGLYSEILGPTLPTLMKQTDIDYQQMGTALSLRSVGLFSGSLIGGWTSDRWAWLRPGQLSLALLVAAVTNVLIPWVRTLPILCVVLCVAGCSHGFLTTNGNPLLASIWGSEASGPFSLMHAGYGLGAAIAPLLAAPFTIHEESNTTENETINVEKNLIALYSNTSDSAIIDPTIPYNLVALILLVCCGCFATFGGLQQCRIQCIRSRKSSKPGRCLQLGNFGNDTAQTESCIAQIWRRIQRLYLRTTRDVFLLLVCVFIMYFTIVGNERVFGKFMFSYAIFGPIQMSAQKGYLLNLIYWIGFGLARVVTCFLAFVMPVQLLLGLVVLGTVFASVGLIFIPRTDSWFFAFTCVFSLFKSPLFPVTLAAINRSYAITGLLVLIVNVGSASGASLLQYAAGSLINIYGQSAFPYLVFATACVVLVAVILLILILRKLGDRFTLNKDQKNRKVGFSPQQDLNMLENKLTPGGSGIVESSRI